MPASLSFELALNLLGFLLSLMGLGIAIWQIREARRSAMQAQTAAQAAEVAAIETQNYIAQKMFLADTTWLCTSIENLIPFVQREEYQVIIAQLGYCIFQTAQMKRLCELNEEYVEILDQTFKGLAKARDKINAKILEPQMKIDKVNFTHDLNQLTDRLRYVAVQEKFPSQKIFSLTKV